MVERAHTPPPTITTHHVDISPSQSISDLKTFLILDQREQRRHTQPKIGIFNPMEIRTMKNIYRTIFSILQIPKEEQEMVKILFSINNEIHNIRYPNELMGHEDFIAILTDCEQSINLSVISDASAESSMIQTRQDVYKYTIQYI